MKKLTAEIGVFWINTICTLKCERCITLTPYHKKPRNFDFDKISQSIDAFFDIYAKIDHFDIEGGESLLHPELDKIIEKAFEYKTCFTRLHILTNGTLVPHKKVLDVCKNKAVMFIIDDYGRLSNKKKELVESLEQNNISYRIDKYHGSDQYYNGWVDFGDFTKKNYSEAELKRVFLKCRQAQIRAPYIKDGFMYVCSIQAARLEHIELKEGEFVDLCNNDISIDEKIKTASRFGLKPLASCRYCKGFDAEDGERYPAAIQLQDQSKKEKIKCL